MRNSSLVEGFCAENVTGLKPAAEAVDVTGAEVKIRLPKVDPKGKPAIWAVSDFGWSQSSGGGTRRRNLREKGWSLWIPPGRGRGAFLGR